MNKAFVREADSDDVRCPRCGSMGEAVDEATVRALVKPEVADRLAQSASYCVLPVCEVVYFDAFERVVTIDELMHPVYPKDPDAPICPCFGATTEMIEEDLAEGGVQRTRKLVEQSKSPAAQCLTHSVNGKSCAAEVQRYYMKRRGT
jgi:hypothetical protein